MKKWILLICLVVPAGFIVKSQHRHMYTDKVVLTVYSNTFLLEPINNQHTFSKFFHGVSYQFAFTKYVEALLGVGFNFIPLTDYCRNCNDAFYGQGKLIEYEGQLGTNINIGRTRKVPYYGFVQLYGFYGKSTYSGDFSGGLSGQGYNFSNEFEKYGGCLMGGIAYDLPERGYIGASIGFISGYHTQKGTVINSGTYFLFTPFQVKVGYYFGKSNFRKKGCNTM